LQQGSFDREYEFQALRELAVQCKKQGVPITDLASAFRLYSRIKRMGAVDVEEAEIFFSNFLNSAIGSDEGGLPPEKIVKFTNELFTISTSESIPPAEVPGDVKQKFEERHQLEEDIKILTDRKDKIKREAQGLLENKDAIASELYEYKREKEQLVEFYRNRRELRKQLELLRTEIRIENTKLEQSKAASALLVHAVNVVSTLLSKGLKDDHIISLALIIHGLWDKISLETLPSDLLHYGSLKKALECLKREKASLKAEVRSLIQEKESGRKELEIQEITLSVYDALHHGASSL
jgi:hypothetical protein